MTRLYFDPEPISVAARDDRPVAFTWRRRTHPVDHIARRWRVDTDWWTFRVAREYWRLTTTTGLLVELYRDMLTDCWYIQRLYD